MKKLIRGIGGVFKSHRLAVISVAILLMATAVAGFRTTRHWGKTTAQQGKPKSTQQHNSSQGANPTADTTKPSGTTPQKAKGASGGHAESISQLRQKSLQRRAELAKSQITRAEDQKMITAAQADLLTKKVSELLAFQVSIIDKPAAARKLARATKEAEVKAWMKKNDIQVSYLRYIL